MKCAIRRKRGLLGWVALVLVLAAAACGGGGGEPARVTDVLEPTGTPGASASPSALATSGATPYATPYATPVATSVATPYATPYATPVATSVATPYATPYATPVATSVATPYATPVATASATPYATPVATPAEQAAKDAWALVFNSRVEFADKVPHLEDAASLESSNAAYAETGESFGGVSLEATAVDIDGDSATITYSFLFAGVPAYEDLVGEMHLVDGVWTVSRETFCGIMASARTPCS